MAKKKATEVEVNGEGTGSEIDEALNPSQATDPNAGLREDLKRYEALYAEMQALGIRSVGDIEVKIATVRLELTKAVH
jgi:hypothetical protein